MPRLIAVKTRSPSLENVDRVDDVGKDREHRERAEDDDDRRDECPAGDRLPSVDPAGAPPWCGCAPAARPAAPLIRPYATAKQRLYEMRLLSEHGGPVPNSFGIEIQTRALARQRVDTVDLAGRLEWWHGPHDIRYLRSDTWARIKLRYTLKDSGGQTIRSGEDSVSDTSYQINVITRSGEVMQHEKDMLARWFRSRFAAG